MVEIIRKQPRRGTGGGIGEGAEAVASARGQLQGEFTSAVRSHSSSSEE